MIVSNIYHHHNSYELIDVIYIFMTKKKLAISTFQIKIHNYS